jgi:hypothetical protein
VEKKFEKSEKSEVLEQPLAIKKLSFIQRLSQNFSFGKATLKFAVLQGFKPEKPQSLT